MRKIALSLAVLALTVVPALAGEKSKWNKKVNVGDKAPTFAGIAATTPKGEEASISLADIKEDVVVVVFLANHCPMVQVYEDRLVDLVNAYEGKSVKVVGIGVSGTASREEDDLNAIKARVKKDPGKINYTYGYDETMQTGRDYGAYATPQFFVLDKTRTIRYMGALDDSNNEGSVKKNYVKSAIDAVLSGKEVEKTETQARGCGISYSRSSK